MLDAIRPVTFSDQPAKEAATSLALVRPPTAGPDGADGAERPGPAQRGEYLYPDRCQ